MPINGKNTIWIVSIIALLLLLVLSVFISVSSGELDISPMEIWNILMGNSDSDNLAHMLITKVRLPRIILGLSVGGSLSLAGVLLQGIYRNPLVEPYTLGISGGASLGVALVIVFGLPSVWGSFTLPVSGFIGSLIIIFLVYILSNRKGIINIRTMLLTGVMISFIASSAMMFLLSISSAENLQGIIFWIMGSLDEPDTRLISFSLINALIILALSYLFVQPLNALRLGEEKARHLGINTNMVIRILFIFASLLAGVSVAVAGVIGFVGLIIPHALRLLFGTDYRFLLISSFLLGATFIILSDVLARTIISPNELPIGVITGLIGGSVFILLMSHRKNRL